MKYTEGPARPVTDSFPFFQHRTLAEVWKGTFAALKKQSEDRKKPKGDAA